MELRKEHNQYCMLNGINGEDRYQLLGSYMKEQESQRGILHVRRLTQHPSRQDCLNTAATDLFYLGCHVGKITSMQLSQGYEEQIGWIAILAELNHEMIVSYVMSGALFQSPNLKFNYSIKGTVVEYDANAHQTIMLNGQFPPKELRKERWITADELALLQSIASQLEVIL